MEHMSHKIKSVLRCLTRKQVIRYLFPVRVAGHGQEDVRLPLGMDNFHGIHMPPFHVTVATWVRSREHYPYSNSACSGLPGCNCINNSFIQVGTDLCLVLPVPFQPTTLNLDVHVHPPLLEQSCSTEYGIEYPRSCLEHVTVVVSHRDA